MLFKGPKEAFNAKPSQKEIDRFVDAAMGSNWAVEGTFLDKYPEFIDAKHSVTHWTALMQAAQCGQSWSVWKLLQMGASIDMRDDDGRTALMWAVMYGHKDTAQSLLENGKADIDAKDNGGSTPLMLAAERGHREVIEMLLEKGANINEKNVVGWDALYYAGTAAFGKATETVDVLEQWSKEQKRQQQEQWLEDTDFSRGLKRALPVSRPLKRNSPPKL